MICDGLLAYRLNNQLGFMSLRIGIGTRTCDQRTVAHAFCSHHLQIVVVHAHGRGVCIGWGRRGRTRARWFAQIGLPLTDGVLPDRRGGDFGVPAIGVDLSAKIDDHFQRLRNSHLLIVWNLFC